MKSKGLLHYVYYALRDRNLSREDVSKIQKERLKVLVDYARENSPYYHNLYKNLGSDPDFTDLPVTTKQSLMQSFDSWPTDPGITLEKVTEFMSSKDNVGRYLLDKCSVSMTSGSTGRPCVVLTDKGSFHLTMALYFVRSFPFKDLIGLGLKRGKYFVIANDGFSMSYNSYRSQILATPLNKMRCQSISVDSREEDIISAINRFKPAILYAYPTTMELLLPHIRNNAVKAKPAIMIIGGEKCSDKLRSELTTHMKSYVFNTYGTSEASLIARTCKEGHLHLFADWVIIEPVDKDYNPVPPGTPSDKLLITNLSNFTQPFIRYEITDRVTLHEETCACGNRMPYIEVEGRTDDILEFAHPEGRVRISPIVLTDPADKDGIIRYQLIQKDYDHLELKLMTEDGYSKEELFEKIEKELRHILSNMDVSEVNITLSKDLPRIHPVSGKYSMVLKDLPKVMPE